MAGTGTLLLGAPGTGRSTALIRRALDFVRAGNDAASVLLLAPGRLAADRLRQEFSERIGATVSSRRPAPGTPTPSTCCVGRTRPGSCRGWPSNRGCSPGRSRTCSSVR